MSGAPSWPPHFFDLTDPEGPGLKPSIELPLLIGSFVHGVSYLPDWRIDRARGELTTLSVVSHAEDEACIGFVAPSASGEVRLACDPSGWLRIEVTVDGACVFRAFLDRPYEEYELWPPGAVNSADTPGRMGKKRNWLRLNTLAWPVLAPLAEGDPWLNLHAMEYMTVYVRLVKEGADAWRPVQAIPADHGFELIAPDDYDPATESWEFPPGSQVRCEVREMQGESAVVAVALASPSP